MFTGIKSTFCNARRFGSLPSQKIRNFASASFPDSVIIEPRSDTSQFTISPKTLSQFSLNSGSDEYSSLSGNLNPTQSQLSDKNINNNNNHLIPNSQSFGTLKNPSRVYNSNNCTPPELQLMIQNEVRKPQTPVDLQQMYKFGENPSEDLLLKSAQFLWEEIPIRVAHRIYELESMPYGLSNQPAISKIKDIYLRSFSTLKTMQKPKNDEDQLYFTSVLEQLLNNHNDIVPMMAKGLMSMRDEFENHGMINVDECPYLVQFLDKFYASRIALRMVAGQHVAMQKYVKGFVGMIDGNCSPAQIVDNASYDASELCRSYYRDAPEIVITDSTKTRFRYMPSELHYMATELLKNSMRAVMEFHPDDPHPIDVVIVGGERDITIKISDRGGGIPRSKLSKIWNYMFSTANHPTESKTPQCEGNGQPPMAGFGYGIPLTRLHARCFDGDLQILSMDGHGTDAYLYLPKLGTSRGPMTII